jgi:hypothetical protein
MVVVLDKSTVEFGVISASNDIFLPTFHRSVGLLLGYNKVDIVRSLARKHQMLGSISLRPHSHWHKASCRQLYLPDTDPSIQPIESL